MTSTTQLPSNIDARHSTFNEIGRDQYNYSTNLVFNEARSGGSDQILLKLKPAAMDSSNRIECLAGTRHDVLDFVDQWMNTISCQNLLWIHGLAGSGKSTLSTTIANRFRERGQLGAFLFFDRDVAERSQPSVVFRTVAFQLASNHPHIGKAISTTVENIPSIAESSIHMQFVKLFIDSISSHHKNMFLVIILDALDECGTAKERDSLLAVLVEEAPRLPQFLRIVVTSRAEFDIHTAFKAQPHVIIQELDITSEDNAEDIHSYISHRLSNIRRRREYLSFTPDWPGDEVIRLLANRAFGLFVWAKTAMEFIDGFNPVKRLQNLLEGDLVSGAESAIDALYRTALKSAGQWDDSDFVEEFRAVVGIILVAQNPLSPHSIDALRAVDNGVPSLHTVSVLQCLLSHDRTIRVLHPSFADFLLSPTRSRGEPWHIDSVSSNCDIAMMCLSRLDAILKRNMCNMTFSQRVTTTLPEDVKYACLYWIDHVVSIKDDRATVEQMVTKFLSLHLLHWFEAMSILGQPRETIRLLDSLSDWFKSNTTHDPPELLGDACRFAQAFMDFIEVYPLSVYLSALPFVPIESALYRAFHDKRTFPFIAGGYEKSWSPLLMLISAHDSESIMTSVAFSPDKQRVACGLSGGVIRIWDLTSNPVPLSKINTHGDCVKALAFSADGDRIVYGSQDGTIGVWDVISEVEYFSPFDTQYEAVGGVAWVATSPDGLTVIAGPQTGGLKVWELASGIEVMFLSDSDAAGGSIAALSFDGSRLLYGSHDGDIIVFSFPSGLKDYVTQPHGPHCPIISVAWSPDDTHIISGSRDGTVCVQEAQSGIPIFRVTGSKDDKIISVALSANGSYCVSASMRGFMHMWDITSRTIVSSFPNEEHNTLCVSLSIDSTQILCGSRDGMIRIWDSGLTTSRGEIPRHEGKRRKGHTSKVQCVLFSPNGKYAVSGSLDWTIRVWSVESGEELNPPMTGRGPVVTMAFFPDGSQLVSGSLSGAVVIWDMRQRAPLIVLGRHEDPVWAVDVSPDASKIISCSRDRTIRVWDAHSGESLSVITEQGTEVLASALSFSADGTRFASGAGNSVRVWDATNYTQLLRTSLTEEPHSTPIHSVAFSPNDKRIICSSTYHTSAIDAASGRCLSTVQHPECATFSIKPQDTIGIINQLGFIVDFRTGRAIFRLPPLLPPGSITASASTKHSLMLGTDTGRVFIIHFPPVLFTSPETQTFASQDKSDKSNHLPVELYYWSNQGSMSPLSG